MRAPQVMWDDLAASKVANLKPKVPITLVGFKQRRVRVCSEILLYINKQKFVVIQLIITKLEIN